MGGVFRVHRRGSEANLELESRPFDEIKRSNRHNNRQANLNDVFPLRRQMPRLHLGKNRVMPQIQSIRNLPDSNQPPLTQQSSQDALSRNDDFHENHNCKNRDRRMQCNSINIDRKPGKNINEQQSRNSDAPGGIFQGDTKSFVFDHRP